MFLFLRSITNLLETELNNTYVKSLEISGNIARDYESGFFMPPNKQVEYVCQELTKDKKLSEEWAEQFSVQATYSHDPFQEYKYKAHSIFLADINNEVFSNGLYVDNLKKMEKKCFDIL
uniref:Uncharacterized protein n=1 Tax=Glossina pallidipes TaxID=7398 RepID=A0A1A9Z2H3_GLOPL